MPDLLLLALSIFAVFRVAYLIGMEDGPFDLFAEIRARAGQLTWLGRGLHCPNCISFWLSLVPAAILARDFVMFGFLWLGIAGVVLLINRWLNGRAK